MLKELDKVFEPKEKGVLSESEAEMIRNKLCILDRNISNNEREVLDLRNLRDFVVMYYGNKMHDDEYNFDFEMNLRDKMSGIVSVIDSRIFLLGGEV